MKTRFFYMMALICSTLFFSSNTLAETNKVNDLQDHIALSRSGGTTRGVTGVEVTATTDGKTAVAISVTDFTGTAVVQIIGGRTSAQYSFYVNEMGYEVINIGTLREATYTIRIILDNEVFEGTFVKVPIIR
ncbi:hypothetical protein SAMN05216364_10124 [Porphyromonadaceae bacterium KHP3R9]|jgi:hypothetical protein|nr:hypothetical protein SAMN05216364_10124 [Porphyromonadaceae bacterium KHP3R9]